MIDVVISNVMVIISKFELCCVLLMSYDTVFKNVLGGVGSSCL